jgi:hypothetical protein
MALSFLVQAFKGFMPPNSPYFFDPIYYHPLYGNEAKVDQVRGPSLNTNWRSEPPDIDRLNLIAGSRHITRSPLYRQAWEDRKKASYYNTNVSQPVQLDLLYSKLGFLQNRQLNYANGTTISTRDKSIRADTFYDSVKRR